MSNTPRANEIQLNPEASNTLLPVYFQTFIETCVAKMDASNAPATNILIRLPEGSLPRSTRMSKRSRRSKTMVSVPAHYPPDTTSSFIPTTPHTLPLPLPINPQPPSSTTPTSNQMNTASDSGRSGSGSESRSESKSAHCKSVSHGECKSSIFAMRSVTVKDDEFVLDCSDALHASLLCPSVDIRLVHRRCMHIHPYYLTKNRPWAKAPAYRLNGVLGLCDVCQAVPQVPEEVTVGFNPGVHKTRAVALEVVEWACSGLKQLLGYVLVVDLDSNKVDIEFLASFDNETIGKKLHTIFARRPRSLWPRRVVYCKSSKLYSDYFHDFFARYSVKRSKLTARPGSTINPCIEAFILNVHRMVKCAMIDMKVPDNLWPWALGWALCQKFCVPNLHPPNSPSFIPHKSTRFDAPQLGPRIFGAVTYKYRQENGQIIFPKKDAVLGMFVGFTGRVMVHNPDDGNEKPKLYSATEVWVNEQLSWEDYVKDRDAYTPERIFDITPSPFRC